jgi:hypothetical protein
LRCPVLAAIQSAWSSSNYAGEYLFSFGLVHIHDEPDPTDLRGLIGQRGNIVAIDQIDCELAAAVFIVNASTPEEAKNILEKFPLGQAGLMGFDCIPLGPLSPRRIINDMVK